MPQPSTADLRSKVLSHELLTCDEERKQRLKSVTRFMTPAALEAKLAELDRQRNERIH